MCWKEGRKDPLCGRGKGEVSCTTPVGEMVECVALHQEGKRWSVLHYTSRRNGGVCCTTPVGEKVECVALHQWGKGGVCCTTPGGEKVGCLALHQ